MHALHFTRIISMKSYDNSSEEDYHQPCFTAKELSYSFLPQIMWLMCKRAGLGAQARLTHVPTPFPPHYPTAIAEAGAKETIILKGLFLTCHEVGSIHGRRWEFIFQQGFEGQYKHPCKGISPNPSTQHFQTILSCYVLMVIDHRARALGTASQTQRMDGEWIYEYIIPLTYF